MGLGIASIGGKDSMSGSFEGLDVPPTLVSFATAIGNTHDVQSPEFKKANSSVVILRPNYKNGLPEIGSLIAIYKTVEQMIDEGKVLAAATPGYGGVAEALFKMCVGNHVGLQLSNDIDLNDLFKPAYGAVILELLDASAGEFLASPPWTTRWRRGKAIDLARLQELWEQKLEPVFPYRKAGEFVPALEHDCPANKRVAPSVRLATPRVVIPVFPGTNCEYDTARAFRRAGGDPHVLVLKNLTPANVAESCEALVKELDEAQILMLPGASPAATSRTAAPSSLRRSSAIRRCRRSQPSAEPARRSGSGHLQRLPGPHQAGSGPLRRDPSHHRKRPDADVQYDPPPPVHAGAYPRGQQQEPLAEQMRHQRRAPDRHQPRRGPLCLQRAAAEPAHRQRPDCDPVR